MKKIIVWGTGFYMEQLEARGCLNNNNEIISYCDNDPEKQGQIFHGKKVISPNEIKNIEFDAIYIASELYFEEIKEQIIKDKLASESSIFSFIIAPDKYEAELAYWVATFKKEGNYFSNESYRERMLGIAGEADDTFWSGKVVVDFGCGPRGSLAWTNTPSVKIGVDVLAERYLRSFGDELIQHNMIYVTCSEERIPIPNNYVDYLITINSLDHVNNLDNITKELLRILKPGGTLLGSFNLNEPCTECEPQTLTEAVLKEKLLKYFEIKSYQVGREGTVLYVRAVKK